MLRTVVLALRKDFNGKGMAWVADICQKAQKLGTICSELQTVGDNIGNQLQTVGNQLQTVGANIGNQLQTVGDNIGNQLQTVGANIGNQLQTVGDNFGNQLQTVGNQLQTVGDNIGNQLQTVGANIGNQLQTVSDNIGNQLQTVGNQLQTVGDNIGNQLQTVGDNIDNQLQTMGENVKQLCSGVVNDVLPAFLPMEGSGPDFSQQNITDLTARESSMIAVDIDLVEKELCNKNALANPSCLDPVEEEHINSFSKKMADIGTREELNASVPETTIAGKLLPTEIPSEVDTKEESSSMESLLIRVHKAYEDGCYGQIDSALPISLEGCNSCVKEEKATELANPTAVLSANSVNLVEYDTSGTCMTASITDSCWVDVEFANEVLESEDYVSVADSVTEISDYEDTEKSTIGRVVEPSMKITRFCELTLGKSCSEAADNELGSVCLAVATDQSYKNKTCKACTSTIKSAKEQECEQHGHGSEILDAGVNQQKVQSLARSGLLNKFETEDHGSDSDWEIV